MLSAKPMSSAKDLGTEDVGHVPSRKLSFDKLDRNAMRAPGSVWARFATQLLTMRTPPEPAMDWVSCTGIAVMRTRPEPATWTLASCFGVTATSPLPAMLILARWTLASSIRMLPEPARETESWATRP